MPVPNFHTYCEEGKEKKKEGSASASRFCRGGVHDLTLALKYMDGKIASYDLKNDSNGLENAVGIRKGLEERGMLDGSFELTYEGTERIINKFTELVKKQGVTYNNNLEGVFDKLKGNISLYTTALFCLVPEIREKVGGDFSSLYRIVLNADRGDHRGNSLPKKRKIDSISNDNFFPLYLRDLLELLPKLKSGEDDEYQRRLHVLIKKQAEYDVFPAFKHGELAALKTLEGLVLKEKDDNMKKAYENLADTYRKYIDFKLIGVNPDFIDPATGEKGVLPSLHQKIGVYHIVEEERFGIWDGGGTGKTAIAVLAQPLIEEKLKKEGGEFRGIVVCPNVGKKAWYKGLFGSDEERYLEEIQDGMVINGDNKDDSFLEALEDKKWVVINYEQLTTNVNGGEKLFIESLVERGVDYTVFDESQHVKSLREITSGGSKRENPKLTHSAAARILSLKSDYFVPMSATPISNGLNDFAVQYHLLNPGELHDPKGFLEMIKNSPRILYTFFNERSVRRTAEDINEDLNWKEIEHNVELDPIQRKVYEQIVFNGCESWWQQAKKSLLDPRLVNPEILKRAGVLGEVSFRNSAKYKKLEELLLADDGPIARGLKSEEGKPEKFIVFSTKYREGVTERGHKGLRTKYEEMGLSDEYEKLELDKVLGDILEEAIQNKFGEEYKIGVIDGTVSKVKDREKIVKDLSDGLVGILCTTETGGESLDFTAANHAYFVDEDYVPSTEQQALWRVIRKGQREKVFINHIRVKDTLDEDTRDYVDQKKIIATMAMDSISPTDKEWELLGDAEGKRLVDMVKKRIGGRSINVYDAEYEDFSDFEIKKIIRRTRKSSVGLNSTDYDTTDAQRIRDMIRQDQLGCWSDPDFAKLYIKTLPNLSPHVVHTAKICDLISRAKSGEIVFPKNMVSEGSGPSILYSAYQSLKPILKANGLKVPRITDRDNSQLMLDGGNNPNQVLACMTGGEDSPFRARQFDMVDHQSISLLKDWDEVHSSLLETNRILRDGGLVELVIKNMRFKDKFYTGMEKLGFELISEKNQGFSFNTNAFKRLSKKEGEHYAESLRAKLASTYVLLARKVDNPGEVNPEDLWFETLGVDEPGEIGIDESRENGNRKKEIVNGVNKSGKDRNVPDSRDNSKSGRGRRGAREIKRNPAYVPVEKITGGLIAKVLPDGTVNIENVSKSRGN